jgi:hypothetical protein
MREAESTRTGPGTEDSGFVRSEAAASPLTPYYWSWYRLVFPERPHVPHDVRNTPSTKED